MHRKSVEKYLGTPLLPCHYLVEGGGGGGNQYSLLARYRYKQLPGPGLGTPTTGKIVVIVPHAWWHWWQVILDLVATSILSRYSWGDTGNMGEWESRLWLYCGNACILHRCWVQHFEQTRQRHCHRGVLCGKYMIIQTPGQYLFISDIYYLSKSIHYFCLTQIEKYSK